MKKTIKILSLFISLVMIFASTSISMFSAAVNSPQISVEETIAAPGSIVDVKVNVKNNPGIYRQAK